MSGRAYAQKDTSGVCATWNAVADGAASLFRWSADGKYLARKGKDLISIYELPSMRLLDKKSLKVRRVVLHGAAWRTTSES